jgi:hypothetical protein
MIIVKIETTRLKFLWKELGFQRCLHAAQALGADACVRKPYVIEKLGIAVRKELDRTK